MNFLSSLCLSLLPFSPILQQEAIAQDARAGWIDIEKGKSLVIETPMGMTAIGITDNTIADFVTIEHRGSVEKIMVMGKAVGSTDLVIQLDPKAPPIQYNITVSRDLSPLVRRIASIVEGVPPKVYPLEDRIVVQGVIDDLNTLEAITQVAEIYDDDFVNLMSVRGDHQVQLEVVFVELSRTGLREMGLDWWWGAASATGLDTSQTDASGRQLPAISSKSPVIAQGVSILADLGSLNIGGVLHILDDKKLSRTLAQPTVTALSGQQAEFLAGGQLAFAVNNGIGPATIQYKDFGVSLVFVPTVLAGDVVDLRVTIEVSEPSQALSVGATTMPGFISRKATTHVRVDNGMTFAIAGLLKETSSNTIAEVPGLGRIPVIGSLFRYVKHTREETELLMLVTPKLVRPLAPQEIPPLPGERENFNPTDLELFMLGLSSRPGSRTGEPTGNIGLLR